MCIPRTAPTFWYYHGAHVMYPRAFGARRHATMSPLIMTVVCLRHVFNVSPWNLCSDEGTPKATNLGAITSSLARNTSQNSVQMMKTTRWTDDKLPTYRLTHPPNNSPNSQRIGQPNNSDHFCWTTYLADIMTIFEIAWFLAGTVPTFETTWNL